MDLFTRGLSFFIPYETCCVQTVCRDTVGNSFKTRKGSVECD